MIVLYFDFAFKFQVGAQISSFEHLKKDQICKILLKFVGIVIIIFTVITYTTIYGLC